MMLPDVNVLISAFRTEHVHHSLSRPWLDGVIASGERFAISPVALAAVIRITTNGKIFAAPSTAEEAAGFGDDVLGNRGALPLHPGKDHWRIFTNLCVKLRLSGQMVSDAWFAALAIEHDCEWVTLDRDFARFPGLRWRTP